MSRSPDRKPPSTFQRPLVHAVMNLHRALLHAQAAEAGITDPYRMLSAAIGDPAFAWLKPLSDLIVATDEAAADAGIPDAAALTPFARTARELTAANGEIATHAGALRDRAPAIATAEADLVAVLRELGA